MPDCVFHIFVGGLTAFLSCVAREARLAVGTPDEGLCCTCSLSAADGLSPVWPGFLCAVNELK